MELSRFNRYHVELYFDPLRCKTFWVMSDRAVPDDIVAGMMPGMIDTVDMFIASPPLMFLRTAELPEVGRISPRAAFLRSSEIQSVPSVFVVNTEFWRCAPGEGFHDQLIQLGRVLTGEFQEVVKQLEHDFNLHLIAV